MSEETGAHFLSLFLPANLGQYGIFYNDFTQMRHAFELPSYGDIADPFNPIRKFTDIWKDIMVNNLDLGNILTFDESMGLWRGKE